VFIAVQGKLRSATLTVAFLVVFLRLSLILAALFGLVLPGLAALLTLARLTTLRSVSGLAALLTFLLHIVCHKSHSPQKGRDCPAPLNFCRYRN